MHTLAHHWMLSRIFKSNVCIITLRNFAIILIWLPANKIILLNIAKFFLLLLLGVSLSIDSDSPMNNIDLSSFFLSVIYIDTSCSLDFDKSVLEKTKQSLLNMMLNKYISIKFEKSLEKWNSVISTSKFQQSYLTE